MSIKGLISHLPLVTISLVLFFTTPPINAQTATSVDLSLSYNDGTPDLTLPDLSIVNFILGSWKAQNFNSHVDTVTISTTNDLIITGLTIPLNIGANIIFETTGDILITVNKILLDTNGNAIIFKAAGDIEINGTIEVASQDSSLTIEAGGSVNIENVSTAGTGNLIISASGSIDIENSISTSTGDITLTSEAAHLTIGGTINSGGALSLATQNVGAVTIEGEIDASTNIDIISATHITANGNIISQTGNIDLVANATASTSSAGLTINSQITSNFGTVTLNSIGDTILGATAITEGNSIMIDSDGSINGAGSLMANDIVVRANTGIGNIDSLSISAISLDATNELTGDINVTNVSATNITVSSLETAGGGTISFEQSGGGDVTFETVKVATDGSAGSGTGDITLTNNAGDLTVSTNVSTDTAGAILISSTDSSGKVELEGAIISATAGDISIASESDVNLGEHGGLSLSTTSGSVSISSSSGSVNLGDLSISQDLALSIDAVDINTNLGGSITVSAPVVNGASIIIPDVLLTHNSGQISIDTIDSDNDGLLDFLEMHFFTNLANKGNDDFDGDGFSNVQEQTRGSNPAEYVIHLNQGWNSVAIARLPENNSVTDIFTDPATGKRCILGNVWTWNGNQFFPVTELFPLRGYWIYSPANIDIIIELDVQPSE